MVAARKWIEFVRSLRDRATRDLDAVAQQIADAWQDLATKDSKADENNRRNRLRRAERDLAEARRQQREIRYALLLDEEDDGLS